MAATVKRSLLLFLIPLMVGPMLVVLEMVASQAMTAKQLPADHQQQKRTQAEQLAQRSITAVNPRPLTMKEIQQARRSLPKKELLLNQARWVNLTAFGSCMFVPVKEQVNERSKLSIFLVRGDGRLAFEISQSATIPQSWAFESIQELRFTELNFDGAVGDFILISHYIDRSQPDRTLIPTVTIYQTFGKGYFLDEKMNGILRDRKVKTTAEAEKILREEFGFLP